MNKMYAWIFAGILISCNSDSDCGCVNISRDLDIALMDAQGNNLLNTADYPIGTVSVKYQSAGSTDLVIAEAPLFIEEGEKRIRIFLNDDKTRDLPVTYISWNNQDTDTVTARFRHDGNSSIMESVWYNGVPVDVVEPQHFVKVLK